MIKFCKLFVLFFVLTVVFTLTFSSNVFAQGPQKWVADELIVKLKPGVSRRNAQAVYHSNNSVIIGESSNSNTHLIRVPPQALEAVKQALSNKPEFEFVQKNRMYSINFVPNDPKYNQQWHLPIISAPEAWDISKGDGIIIAILDTGVDPAHPDFNGSLVAGRNIYNNNNNTIDMHGHGTAVAGSAAAIIDNAIGVASVAGQSLIMPIRITDANSYGYSWTITQGIEWAVNHGANVINVSFSGVVDDPTIISTSKIAFNNGVIVVAAAGNCGCYDNTQNTPYILSVSATDSNDDPAYFTSYGSYVDVAAPGLGIYTTSNGGGYGGVSGTSFSSPITAGLVALIMSTNPDLSSSEIIGIIESTSNDLGSSGYDMYYGNGRINAYEAVLAAKDDPPVIDIIDPTVDLTYPTDGITISGTLNITVMATDDTGITGVELYIDSTLFASDNTDPYSFVWDTTEFSDGAHILQIIAYDAAGNSSNTPEITVNVDNTVGDLLPPEGFIIVPTEGSTVSKAVKIRVQASDNKMLKKIELFIDNSFYKAVKCRTATCTAVFSWNTKRVSSGQHILAATIYDKAGNTGETDPVNVIVK